MTDTTPRDRERLERLFHEYEATDHVNSRLLRASRDEWPYSEIYFLLQQVKGRDAALRDARRQIEERDATIAEQARELAVAQLNIEGLHKIINGGKSAIEAIREMRPAPSTSRKISDASRKILEETTKRFGPALQRLADGPTPATSGETMDEDEMRRRAIIEGGE